MVRLSDGPSARTAAQGAVGSASGAFSSLEGAVSEVRGISGPAGAGRREPRRRRASDKRVELTTGAKTNGAHSRRGGRRRPVPRGIWQRAQGAATVFQTKPIYLTQAVLGYRDGPFAAGRRLSKAEPACDLPLLQMNKFARDSQSSTLFIIETRHRIPKLVHCIGRPNQFHLVKHWIA